MSASRKDSISYSSARKYTFCRKETVTDIRVALETRDTVRQRLSDAHTQTHREKADRTRNRSVQKAGRRKERGTWRTTTSRIPGVAEGLGEREALIEGRHVREERSRATTRLGTRDRSFLWQSMAEWEE